MEKEAHVLELQSSSRESVLAKPSAEGRESVLAKPSAEGTPGEDINRSAVHCPFQEDESDPTGNGPRKHNFSTGMQPERIPSKEDSRGMEMSARLPQQLVLGKAFYLAIYACQRHLGCQGGWSCSSCTDYMDISTHCNCYAR